MKPQDQQVLNLAAERHGVVTREQLLALGLSKSAIGRRLDGGLLTRYRNGVYLVDALEGPGTVLQAALVSYPEAAASHFSAASLWKLRFGPRHRPLLSEIVLHRSRRPRLPGVTVHLTRYLPQSHLGQIDGLAITTPERTLVDTTYRLRSLEAARYVTQRAIADSIADPEQLIRVHLQMARRGRAGTVFTRTLYREILGRDGYPTSELEIRTEDMLIQHGIHGFRPQFKPPWYDGARGIVDFVDETARVILEVDGRQWHSISQAQRADRQRDRTAQKHGYRVIRVTWADVIHDASELCQDIREICRQRVVSSAA